jgi:hypothetical protein
MRNIDTALIVRRKEWRILFVVPKKEIKSFGGNGLAGTALLLIGGIPDYVMGCNHDMRSSRGRICR